MKPERIFRFEVQQHWGWLTLRYHTPRRTFSHQTCHCDKDLLWSVKDLCCKNAFQTHHFRGEGNSSAGHLPTTSAQETGSSQQDLDAISTFIFQLSWLELGRTTEYKEGAADHRCQNSLPALYQWWSFLPHYNVLATCLAHKKILPEWCPG